MCKVPGSVLLRGVKRLTRLLDDTLYPLCVLLGCFMLAAQPGKSDTIVINDLNDVITVTDTGGSRTVGLNANCKDENQCQGGVVSNDGATTSALLIDDIVLTDPVTGAVSDTFFGQSNFASVYAMFICSDQEINPCPPSSVNSVVMEETGQPQLVGHISWTDGTTDTVYFISDANADAPVPEPNTLMLLGSGLLGFASLYRRRFKKSCPC